MVAVVRSGGDMLPSIGNLNSDGKQTIQPARKGEDKGTKDQSKNASTAVFRLSWTSRHHSLISSPLLRDYFLTTSLPSVNEPAAISVFDTAVYLYLISTNSLTNRTLPSTSLYLIPPLPPFLCEPRLQIVPRTAFHDATFFDLVNLSFATSILLNKLKVPAPNSFLVHAPHGAGKSAVVASLARQNNVNLIRLQPTQLLTYYTSKTALYTSLTYYLSAAVACQPSIFLIDDADFLFPPDDDLSAAAAICLIRELQAAREQSHRVTLVFIVSPEPGAIHRDVAAVFDQILSLGLNPACNWACELAARWAGLSGRQVAGLIARRNVETITQTLRLASTVSCELESAPIDELSKDEILTRWGNLSLELGGNQFAQKALKRLLLYPIIKAHIFDKLNITPAKGVLLYGPPGTGKTMLLRKTAEASNYNVLPLDAAALSRSEVGESEKRLYKSFARAERLAPCVVFLDEIDAIFSAKGFTRLVSVLSVCFDRLSKAVVVATTNKPWMISKGLLRPDRLEYVVKVPLPDDLERRQIAAVYAKKMDLEGKQRDALINCAGEAARFSGADIAGACRRAVTAALRRRSPIAVEDIKHSFSTMVPSVSVSDEADINYWTVYQ